MTDDQPRWMHNTTYVMEDHVDLHGNHMHLPAILRHCYCHMCRVMVVRAGLSRWQKAAIQTYMRAGLIQFRHPENLNGRPVCRRCHRDTVGACDATIQDHA